MVGIVASIWNAYGPLAQMLAAATFVLGLVLTGFGFLRRALRY